MNKYVSDKSYIIKRLKILKKYLAPLNNNIKEKHYKRILSFYNDNGGFSGRRGTPNLYYTAFAVKALFVLDKLSDELKNNIKNYLQNAEMLELVDVYCFLVTSYLIENSVDVKYIHSFIQKYKTDNDGYAKRERGKHGSVYFTSLALINYNMLDYKISDYNFLKSFVKEHRNKNGGYSELLITGQTSTIATAFGMTLDLILFIKNNVFKKIFLFFSHLKNLLGTKNYLISLQHRTGGWLATKKAILADLGSSYTSLMSLDSVLMLKKNILKKNLPFLDKCRLDNGGYSAGPWEKATDVEYTFYGLGIRALMHKYKLIKNEKSTSKI